MHSERGEKKRQWDGKKNNIKRRVGSESCRQEKGESVEREKRFVLFLIFEPVRRERALNNQWKKLFWLIKTLVIWLMCTGRCVSWLSAVMLLCMGACTGLSPHVCMCVFWLLCTYAFQPISMSLWRRIIEWCRTGLSAAGRQLELLRDEQSASGSKNL